MNVIFEKVSPESISKAGQILRDGGIAAFPTETVYGLGAVFTDASAVKRIFEVKGRDEGKPLSVLISSPKQIYPYAEVTDEAKKIMDAFWPGPLTIVLKLRPDSGIPAEVTAGGSTIGFRMPASETTLNIIDEAASPLAAPSANLSGRRSSVTADEVMEDLGGLVDIIIDGGPCSIGISSTVLDLSSGNAKVLRAGSITETEIFKILKKASRRPI